MLKMLAGDLLMIGLSVRNLDEFEAKPGDTFIRIKGEENLPLDVILSSGTPMRATGIEKPTGLRVFLIGLGLVEFDLLRQNPGKSYITLDKATYGIPVDIIIFSGESEEKMIEQFAEFIRPDTKVKTDPRLKN